MRFNLARIIGNVLAAAYIIYNIFDNPNAYNNSNEFTIYFQKVSGIFIEQFFFMITYIGFPGVPCIALILVAIVKDKWIPIKISFFLLIMGYIIGLLKIIYAGPRPWFTDPDIIGFQCSATDFGRPSGHAFSSTYALLLFYKYYIYDDQTVGYSERIKTEEVDAIEDEITYSRLLKSIRRRATSSYIEEESPKKKLMNKKMKRSILIKPQAVRCDESKIVILVAILTLELLIGLSRVYLGAHSNEEILLGWAYGAIFFIETVYVYDKVVDNLFLYFLDGRHRSNNLKLLIVTIFMYIALLLLPVTILSFGTNNERSPTMLWKNMIANKCGGKYFKMIGIEALSLYLCVSIAPLFGVILGLMFTRAKIMRTPDGLTLKQLILRKVVSILIYSVILGLILLVPTGDNYFVRFLINANIGSFLLTFTGFVFMPEIYKKLDLVPKEDDESSERFSLPTYG